MSSRTLLEEAERIVTSEVMKGSSTYQNLLLYLARSSVAGTIPKETTIALEIFGRRDFDPSQSTLIRVYIYNLRKKIDTYYDTIGLHSPQRLLIPKGNYKTVLEIKKNRSLRSKPIKPSYLIALVCVLGLLTFLLLRPVNADNSEKTIKTTNLWYDLIETQVPLTVVIGDFYIFNEQSPKSRDSRFIRDPEINSTEDYQAYTKRTGDSMKTNTVNFSMLPFYSNFWVKDLSHTFEQHERTFSLRTASRFNPVELQDHNIIAVGMLKTLGMFKNYFDNSAYSLNENYYLVYKDPNNGKETTYTPSGNPSERHKDYTFIAKIPGPGTNKIYLFGGLWDIGADEGLKNFTNPELRTFLEHRMTQEFGYVPDYYEILLEANGYDRMGIDSKIIRINEIQGDKVVWDFDVKNPVNY